MKNNDRNELLGRCLNSGLPFSLYREPGKKRVYVLIETSQKGNNNKQGFVFVPFDRQHKPLFINADILAYEGEALPEIINAEKGGLPYKAGNCNVYIATEDEYCEQVRQAVNVMKNKEIQKIVLSHIRKYPRPEDFNIFHFFDKICDALPEAFCYVFFHPEAGLWCGASPELLMRYDGALVETVALAGTRNAENKTAEDAHWKEKERVEQQYVSDYISECLQTEGVEDIHVTGPVTARAGNLFHLKTFFKGKAGQNFSAERLAAALCYLELGRRSRAL